MSKPRDTLSRIGLAPAAIARWGTRAQEIAREAREHGISSPEDVPDELAREEADGSLTIYITMPDGAELSMRVEPGEWAWTGERNH